ncbi:translation initiation factor IF-2 [Thermatribacter velox]|jgi:translation initiation factor IF-2|uniref:Translation initiation factor IF-2 n=1 Tax=Thermatribacter velox TaxID=3039681 RepID=A0ABZ2Y8D5_9BACT
MPKIRIYKIAEQFGIPTSELIDILKDLGAEVKNHMSSIDDDLVELIKEEIDYRRKRAEELQKKKERTITIDAPVTLRDAAKLFNQDLDDIIIRLADWNIIFDTRNPLPPLALEKLAREQGWEIEWKEDVKKKILEAISFEPQPRPPVVTILGHVDHGKTTLLDAIRKSRVAESELGGITQKIGAYQIEINGQKITFIDTPGHEAFTSMRARGAQVTDIAVLVVAADDGVMPQTEEAIQHARAADVPIIVAINKIDKPGANPDRVKQQLAERGLVPEEWGGETICVNISALQKKGIAELLEMILLQAELLELKARKEGHAVGTTIESRIDRGKGPVATVIVQEGTLRVGDYFVAGTTWGKVRSLFNDLGKPMKEAEPSTPVEVVGFTDLPPAGTKLMVTESEKIARIIAERRAEIAREKNLKTPERELISLEELFAREEGKTKEVNLLLKADFQGSLEAVEKAVSQLSTDEVKLNVIYKGVGNVTEADVMLASASSGVIIGFNVKLPNEVAKTAKREKVDVRTYRIIYDLIEDLQRAIQGMKEPVKVEEVIGRAEVRAVFKIPRTGTVAGCYIIDGKLERNALVRVIRNGETIQEGLKISSLKRFKDDVKEVTQGYECGVGLNQFEDFKEGDILEAYLIREEK